MKFLKSPSGSPWSRTFLLCAVEKPLGGRATQLSLFRRASQTPLPREA
jgi:hypothetical protein